MARIVVSILIVVLCSETCCGAVQFLPGDAFFHSTVTVQSLERFSRVEGDRMRFGYLPADAHLRVLGSSIGIRVVNVDACREGFKDELRSAVVNCCGGEHDKVVDVFVYNKDFSFVKHRIGLKYNEAWVEDVTIVGVFTGETTKMPLKSVYSSFAESKEMVIEDWLFASRIDALAAKVPADLDWKRVGRPLEGAISINESACKFVFVARDQLQNVIERREKARFVQLHEGKVSVFTFRDEKWHEANE